MTASASVGTWKQYDARQHLVSGVQRLAARPAEYLTQDVHPRRKADPFADREDAGRALALLLSSYARRDDVVVLGLPRGGVPVAAEVASALGAILDVLIVRKLGVPRHPELAMGAIAGVGQGIELVRNDRVLARVQVSDAEFDAVHRAELTELHRRSVAYRGDRPAVALAGQVVIIVDDGLATGSTMRAAVAAVRRQQPRRLVVAVPVGPVDSGAALGEQVDEVVVALTPARFQAVRQGYQDFSETSDDEVLAALGRR
jgi:putative phosphoribosyl transferase